MWRTVTKCCAFHRKGLGHSDGVGLCRKWTESSPSSGCQVVRGSVVADVFPKLSLVRNSCLSALGTQTPTPRSEPSSTQKCRADWHGGPRTMPDLLPSACPLPYFNCFLDLNGLVFSPWAAGSVPLEQQCRHICLCSWSPTIKEGFP